MNGSNGINCNAEAVVGQVGRNLEVSQWLESLGYAVERLDVTLSNLSSRLQPLLGIEDLKGCEPTAGPAGCELAQRIQTRTQQLNALDDHMQGVIRRLEI